VQGSIFEYEDAQGYDLVLCNFFLNVFDRKSANAILDVVHNKLLKIGAFRRVKWEKGGEEKEEEGRGGWVGGWIGRVTDGFACVCPFGGHVKASAHLPPGLGPSISQASLPMPLILTWPQTP
jgi:hypothetical protein